MAHPLLKPIANDDVITADLGEMTPDRLPIILRQAIRRQLWVPEHAHTLRDMATKIGQHRMAGYDVEILLPVLAQAVTRTPPVQVPLQGVEEEILNLAWAMLAVPRAWNNPVLRAMGNTQDVAELDMALDLHIAGAQRIRQLNTVDVVTAHARISHLVEEAKAAFPQLGLSFGYIGGVHTWGDDRAYMVFAKLATKDCHGACNVSFGSFAHDRIGDMLAVMERDFAAWLAKTAERLAAGDLRKVG